MGANFEISVNKAPSKGLLLISFLEDFSKNSSLFNDSLCILDLLIERNLTISSPVSSVLPQTRVDILVRFLILKSPLWLTLLLSI